MCNAIMINDNTIANVTAKDYGITNKELADITNTIIGCSYNMRLFGLMIAAKVAYIADNSERLLTDFDNDIVKYGVSVLGVKKAQVYALAEIGRRFLNENGECLLPQPVNVKFNKTQLQAMLPISKESAFALVESGEITPSMTVANIKQVVKAHQYEDETPEQKIKREEREAKAEKRNAAKEAMERATIGTQVATIQVFELSTGAYRVVINGDDSKDKRRNAAILKYVGIVNK